jgi:hypothetical protein
VVPDVVQPDTVEAPADDALAPVFGGITAGGVPGVVGVKEAAVGLVQDCQRVRPMMVATCVVGLYFRMRLLPVSEM